MLDYFRDERLPDNPSVRKVTPEMFMGELLLTIGVFMTTWFVLDHTFGYTDMGKNELATSGKQVTAAAGTSAAVLSSEKNENQGEDHPTAPSSGGHEGAEKETASSGASVMDCQ